jgi:hypothetical protein
MTGSLPAQDDSARRFHALWLDALRLVEQRCHERALAVLDEALAVADEHTS